MLIGRARDLRSANVHSSIPGRVVEISSVVTADGAESPAAIIELAGEFDRSARNRGPIGWEGLSADEIMARVGAAGVVGLGGGLEPAYAKLASARGKAVEALVANGVECEPYLSGDHRLMLEKAPQIAEGIRMVQRVAKARRVILAVSEEAADVVPFFQEIFQRSGEGATVEVLEERYPQGEASALFSALRLGPSSLVFNVATLFAVWESVAMEKPLIERVVTVAGSAVRRPRNLKVRLGTPFGELFEECGGLSPDCAEVILGGPMVGHAQSDFRIPVTKGVSGVIALDRRDARADPVPCIRCGACVDACPWGLWPVTLFRLVDRRDIQRAAREGLLECTECGACAYACPSRVPLVALLRRGKELAAGRGTVHG
jgi:electron transport complex protein RnfC